METRHSGGEPGTATPIWRMAIFTLSLCSMYVILSASLINFNKYLMHSSRFPHALLLTALHMGVSWILSLLMYLLRPSLFPGMINAKGKYIQVVKYFIPIGGFFAVTLYTSNKAYQYCSVSFLQFMKESNVATIFLMSCAVGLQRMSRTQLAVICWMLAGVSLAVAGEVHFALPGFILQAISCLADCSKSATAEWVMSGSDLKLDPLSYTMFVAPICFLILMICVCVRWTPDVGTDLFRMIHLLVPNAILAFLLNVNIAAVLKNCSAVGFVITGLVKDIVIVVASCLFFGTAVSATQVVGFVITLSGVSLWSSMKLYPQSAAVLAVERMLCLPRDAGEDSALLAPSRGDVEKKV